MSRNACVSLGWKTSPARGEKIASGSAECVSTRPASTSRSRSVSEVSDWRYAPNSVVSSSSSYFPLIVPSVIGFV